MLTRTRTTIKLHEILLESLSRNIIIRESFYVYRVDYDTGDVIIGPFDSAIVAEQFIENKNVFGGCVFTGQQILNQFIPTYMKYQDYNIEPEDDDYDISEL